MNRVILGVSHKMYFGYQQTCRWCEQIAGILTAPASRGSLAPLPLFTFPAAPAIDVALQYFAPTPMATGGQNICAESPGAWTGETSAAMLNEMGCRYVEVVHAERRHHFHESPSLIRQKIRTALDNHLTPVICLGDPALLSISDAVFTATEDALELLSGLNCDPGKHVIFAWEPQWAIGAQAPADTQYIRAVCRGLRENLRQRTRLSFAVIYGGSAGPGLLPRLWPDVDGLFLGRFAHNPENFATILQEAILLTSASPDNDPGNGHI